MSEQRIMYVCSECADNDPESCGHYDRNDLRVMPDGKWLCECCFDETNQGDRGNFSDDEYVDWSDMPAAPEWGPVAPANTQASEKTGGSA